MHRPRRRKAGKKAEALTSDFTIGFQGRLPANDDSPRLPFPSNDGQVLGSRGRGCEMRQRQGLVIGGERKQTRVGLLIMRLTWASITKCNMFPSPFTVYLDLNYISKQDIKSNGFPWKWSDTQRGDYREGSGLGLMTLMSTCLQDTELCCSGGLIDENATSFFISLEAKQNNE